MTGQIRGVRNSQLVFLVFVVVFSADSFFTHQVPPLVLERLHQQTAILTAWPMSSCIKKTTKRKIMEPPSVPRSSVSGILYSTFSDGLGAEKHTHFSNNKSFSFAYSIMQSYKKCEKVSCLICSASFAYPTTKRRAETIGKMLLGEHGNPQGFVWNVQSYMSAIWPELQEVHTK